MQKKLLFVFVLLIVVFVLNFPKNTKTKEPYLLDKSSIIEKDLSKGYTVKDKNGNEWVWISVPSKIFKQAKSDKDYYNIEKDIKEYTKDYTNEEYADLDNKNDILSSIYKYNGFYVSRYEIGTTNIRKNNSDNLDTPYSKKNLYVYNHITFKQTQKLVKKLKYNNYKTNLLYGFQWDLICKYIEENGYTYKNKKITKDMINTNSSSWGNYFSSSFTINGKYSTDYGITYILGNNKEKEVNKSYLLTTGASDHNKTLNIYDFAGNASEWTLEKDLNNQNNNVVRDGNFYFNYGGNDPVSGRYSLESNVEDANYGFRAMLYKN